MNKISRFHGKDETEFLETLKKVMKASNNKCFLIAGTLLACIRDKKFIPWDGDMDVGILEEDWKDEFIENFQREGLQILGRHKWKEEIMMDKSNVGKWSHVRVSNQKENGRSLCCVFILRKGKGNYRYYTSSKFLIGYPEKCMAPLTKTKFYDLTVNIPKNYKKTLEYIYGKNWKIPNKNWKGYHNKARIRKGKKYLNNWSSEKLKSLK